MRISDWSSDVCSSDLLAQGIDVLLEIDWQGARKVREKLPGALSVFIFPPSRAELARRLRTRGQDSDERSEERRVGKQVSVRVDLGGCRTPTKKETQNPTAHHTTLPTHIIDMTSHFHIISETHQLQP